MSRAALIEVYAGHVLGTVEACRDAMPGAVLAFGDPASWGAFVVRQWGDDRVRVCAALAARPCEVVPLAELAAACLVGRGRAARYIQQLAAAHPRAPERLRYSIPVRDAAGAMHWVPLFAYGATLTWANNDSVGGEVRSGGVVFILRGPAAVPLPAAVARRVQLTTVATARAALANQAGALTALGQLAAAQVADRAAAARATTTRVRRAIGRLAADAMQLAIPFTGTDGRGGSR